MLLVIVGGAVGSLARYGVSVWCRSQPWAQGFPVATLFVNVLGSLILAATGTLITQRLPPGYEHWFLLIGTGFCGGFTTFSTFEWETYLLIRDNRWWHASLNVFGSFAAGFAGILLGVGLVRFLFPRV
jgi:CrcB protein